MLWERQKVNKNTTNMFRTSSPFIHQWFILNKEHFTITMSHNTFTLWTWWGKHGLWVLWVRGENNPPPQFPLEACSVPNSSGPSLLRVSPLLCHSPLGPLHVHEQLPESIKTRPVGPFLLICGCQGAATSMQETPRPSERLEMSGYTVWIGRQSQLHQPSE